MARRKKMRTPTFRTILVERLESGQSIVGLKGYVPAANCNCGEGGKSIYVAVKVLGLVPNDSSVQVKVGICSGSGEMLIGPACWVDTLAQIKVVQNKEERVERALAAFKNIVSPNYLHERKRRIEKYVKESMSEEQQAEFKIHLKEEFKVETVKNLSISQVRDLARVATMVVNELEGGDIQDYEFGR